ncbi:MAG: glycosyltransferase family 2 protein [Candidatus Binatia bacterium]
MSRPLVSVITAARNAERYLAEAISSVQHQTFENWEYIVADNASSDATADVAREFLGDPRIRLITVPRKGKAVARNAAVVATSGRYIANLDSDDFWREDKLQRQLELLEHDTGISLAYTGVNVLNQLDSRVTTKLPVDLSKCRDPLRYLLTVSNPITHSSVVIRRDALTGGHYQDEAIEKVDEQMVYWRALLHSDRTGFVPEPLTTYRVHGDSEFRRLRVEEFCAWYARGLEAFFALPDLPASVLRWRRQAYAAMYCTSGTVGLDQRSSIMLSLTYLLKSMILRPSRLHTSLLPILRFLVAGRRHGR